MNYAVLILTNFSLHALRRSDPSLVHKPVALVVGEGRKAALSEVSPEAQGIEPGFAVTLAMARCPGIILRTRDPAAETEAQKILLSAGFTLSPRVEATGLGHCTVDLQGSDLTRVEAEMRRQVAELTAMGLPARGGIASSPLLATYVAREANPVAVVHDSREFLRTLPLSVCEPSASQLEVLRNWGVKTLGELTALTKGDIGQRLGSAGVELWERAAGETTTPLHLVELPQTFRAEWIYEPPVDTMEPLAFKLQRYSERIAAELRGGGFVSQKLTLTLHLEDGLEHGREFRLPEPSAAANSWMRVFLSHLETVKLDSLLARVCLVAEPTRPLQKQDGLFDTGLRDPAVFWENLARVGALVGDDRVGMPCLADTHRPDTFSLVKPVDSVPAPEEPSPHPLRGLVLRRFRPGWPVSVQFADGKPVSVTGGLKGRIIAYHGPRRADGDWWNPSAWASETWEIELDDGSVYQLARRGDVWFVEGVFD